MNKNFIKKDVFDNIEKLSSSSSDMPSLNSTSTDLDESSYHWFNYSNRYSPVITSPETIRFPDPNNTYPPVLLFW